MKTPIYDFVQNYITSDMSRFHMPGHKGKGKLGFEPWDITEVKGADALYEANGIIAQSEQNATMLFGSQRTVYSTEGSSQGIRAMLYLAVMNRPSGSKPVVVAARNVHKAFVYAAALLDIEVVWLWSEKQDSLCGCPISAQQLERVLCGLQTPPAAVYLTSPDYLGGISDIPALAEVCHRYGTLLAVDNAHGAYLRFLEPSQHPLDLGADLCCDSAHKTLPVLTGGAYLHIAKRAPASFSENAKTAMEIFGSTSPSYLTLISLDCCNKILASSYKKELSETVDKIEEIRCRLREAGWSIQASDPLRITLRAPRGKTGIRLQQLLREHGMECEYADADFLVLMLTSENHFSQLEKLLDVLGKNTIPERLITSLPQAKGEQVVSIREALFAPHETVSIESALGRICGAPTVSCPPAIPIVISGERIGEEAIALFRHYEITCVDALK